MSGQGKAPAPTPTQTVLPENPAAPPTPSQYDNLLQTLSGQEKYDNNDPIRLLIASLQEGMAQNRKSEAISTAPRTDAYGNVTRYDPLTGWQTVLTPTQKKTFGRDQAETLLSLTQDAPRNRAASKRQDERSRSGDAAFKQALNDYRYRPQKTAENYKSDAQKNLVLDAAGTSDETANLLGRQLVRTGQGGDYSSLFKAADARLGEELPGINAKAGRQGAQDFLTYEGGADSQAQKEVDFYRGIADDAGQVGIRAPNSADKISDMGMNAILAQIQTLLQNEATRSGGAKDIFAAIKSAADPKNAG